MSLKTSDVFATLNDPVALDMAFIVGPILVTGIGYRLVRDRIMDGSIVVVDGDPNSGLAFYDSTEDKLTTQAGNPPADLDQRGLLLHECTHALIDVCNMPRVTRHIDELTAYIAQHVYLVRSQPTWTVAPNNPPWKAFFQSIFDLIKRHDLHNSNFAMITTDELEPLRLQLAALPYVNYGTFRKESLSGSNGLKDFGTFGRMSRLLTSMMN